MKLNTERQSTSPKDKASLTLPEASYAHFTLPPNTLTAAGACCRFLENARLFPSWRDFQERVRLLTKLQQWFCRGDANVGIVTGSCLRARGRRLRYARRRKFLERPVSKDAA